MTGAQFLGLGREPEEGINLALREQVERLDFGLDWLISTTAMITLSWSRATRDLLKSFGCGIAALHRLDAATKLPFLAARPIASIGPAKMVRRF
jgi:hypothetical protein